MKATLSLALRGVWMEVPVHDSMQKITITLSWYDIIIQIWSKRPVSICNIPVQFLSFRASPFQYHKLTCLISCLRFLLTRSRNVATHSIHASVTSMASGVSSQWQIISSMDSNFTFIEEQRQWKTVPLQMLGRSTVSSHRCHRPVFTVAHFLL